MSSITKYYPLLSPPSSPTSRPLSPGSLSNVDVELEPFSGGQEHPALLPSHRRRGPVARFCRIFAMIAVWGSLLVLAVALILYVSYNITMASKGQ